MISASDDVEVCKKQLADLQSKLVILEAKNSELTDENKQLKTQLEREMYQFSNFINYLPLGLFVSNKNGEYVKVNKKAAEVTGYSVEELQNMKISDITADDSTELAFYEFLKLIETGYSFCEFKYKHKFFGERWWDVAATKLSEDVFIGIVRDISDRKISEILLKESEEKYRNLFVNASQCIIIAQDGRIKFANPETINITGYDEQELSQMPFTKLIYKDDVEKVVQNHIRRLKGEDFEKSYNFRIITKNGLIKWLEINAVLVNWDGSPATLNFLSDITEKIEYLDKIKLNEERLRLAFTNSRQGWFDLDIVTGRTEVSPEYAIILGYEPEEFNSSLENWFNNIHPDDINLVKETYNKALKLKETSECEYRRRHKNGDWSWFHTIGKVTEFDNNGKPIRLIGIHTDITERKIKEHDLEEKERNYREIFNSPNEAIFIDDAATGKMIEVNESMLKMYGFDNKDEVLNGNIGDLSANIGIYNQENAIEFIRKTIEVGPQTFEWLAKKKNGELFWTEVSLKKTEIGGKGRILAVVRDISKRKKAEMELNKQKNKLHIISDLISDITFSCIKDADNNTYIDWMTGACEIITGYTIEEFIDMKCWGFLVIKEDFHLFKDCVINLDINEVKTCELRITVKSGEIKWIKVYSKKTQDISEPNIERIYGAIIDIHSKKIVENELKESQERFNLAMKASQDGLFDWNLITNEIYYSPGLKSMLGYEENEIKNEISEWERFINPQDKINAGLAFNEHINGDSNRIEIEYQMLHKNGTWVDILTRANAIFDENGKPLRLIGTHVDITELKKIQRKLEENDVFITTVLDNLPIGVAVNSVNPTIDFEYINDNFIKYYHTKKEDLMKDDNFWNAVYQDEEYREIIKKRVLEDSNSGDVSRMFWENISIKRDNKTYYINARNIPVPDKKLMISTVWDVTHQRENELALIESEERLLTLINSTPDIICFKDGNGRWLIANDSDLELFNLKEVNYKNLTDLELSEHTHPIYKEAFKTCVKSDEAAWQMRELSRNEESIPTLSGENRIFDIIKVPLFENNQRKALVVLGRDITDKKKVEKKLIESENNFKLMINNSPDAVIIMNTEGITQFVSHQINNIGNHRPESFLYKNMPVELIYEEDLTLCFNAFEILRSGGAIENLEYRFHGANNEIIWIQHNATPIFNDGKIAGYQNNIRNITKQKLLENELIKAKEKAEENDKLKTAFLQNISHEIRTPLNGIIGFAKFINSDDSSMDEIKDFANIIQQSGNRLLEIVNNVLDISKIETGQIVINNRFFNINQTLNSLYKFYEPVITSKGLKFNLTTSLDDSQLLYSDETKINQILTNLLGNAVKFTSKGSIDFGYFVIGDKIQFYVRDTGIGISEDFIDKCFDRFTQSNEILSENYDGAGLGLAICKGLIELLGGKIWVSSQINSGTTFFFTLPYNKEENNMDPNDKKSDNNISIDKKLHVLIAEDDFVSYIFLKKVLEKLKFTTERAEHGLKAIEMVKNNPNFDLVLMDIKMPIMNGLEATKAIKEIAPNLCIIAQTAYAFSDERLKVLSVGCDDYISKPIEKDLLIELLQKHNII